MIGSASREQASAPPAGQPGTYEQAEADGEGSCASGGDVGGMVAAPTMQAGYAAEAANDMASGGEERAQSWTSVSTAPRFASVSLGGGQTLELKRMRVTVKVEGFRARTVVDHVFYNPHDRTIEGTFRYPLPAEATVSGYAMFLGTGGSGTPEFFGPDDQLRQMDPRQLGSLTLEQVTQRADAQLWGELRTGRIVRQAEARETYENVTRRRVDPALVEQVAPNTFEARVFPIAAHGYHRVIVSYEQNLPRVGRALEYAFAVPQANIDTFELTVAADKPAVRAARYVGSLQGIADQSNARGIAFRYGKQGATEAGTLAFQLEDAAPQVEIVAGENPIRHESHFVMRVHGDDRMAGQQGASSDQAVFVLDTSLSEHADRFAIDVALLEGILEQTPGIRRFNVITFDAGARWLSEAWIANDARGREDTIARLRGVLLEGGTDLSAALGALASPPQEMNVARGTPTDVFLLSDGAINLGDTDADAIVAAHPARSPFRARFFAYRTGLGAENVALMRSLTREGAVFNCLTRDSVPACATAHQRSGLHIARVEIVGRGAQPARVSDVIVAGQEATLSRNGTLMLAGKLEAAGAATLKLIGTIDGREVTIEHPIELAAAGELAPRAWAEIAVAELLATHDDDLESYAIALSQHYRVPSRLASFLVLETDAEYHQYGLDEEQGRAGASVSELTEGQRQQRTASRSAWDRIERVFSGPRARNRLASIEGGEVYRRLATFVGRQDALLDGGSRIPLVMANAVPEGYRRGLTHDADAVALFRDEAERRHTQGDLGAAIRALTSLVENDPGSSEIARAVAYRLHSWDADATSANLLLGVLEQRPYEPQSYRDLANVLWTRRPAVTAMLFEAVLAGPWDSRFVGLDTVVREEYALFIRDHRRSAPNHPFTEYLAQRERALGLGLPASDMRVTMTWNTDNTDIDLWVTGPDGDKCYYAQRDTETGQLLDDITRGFGPERYQTRDGSERGEFLVQAHYYGNNGNRLVAETHVTITIATHLGTPQERVQRYDAVLANPGDVADIARIDLGD